MVPAPGRMIKMNYIIIAVFAASMVGTLTIYMELVDERAGHATTKAEHAIQVADSLAASLAVSEQLRMTEQEMDNATETHATEIRVLQRDLGASIDNAGIASRRLRDATTHAAVQARGQCPITAAPGMGEAAEDPIGMLAHVLGLVDEAAGRMAAIADERGIAGSACSRLYEDIRSTVNEQRSISGD